jgi:predicted transcriptional regulator
MNFRSLHGAKPDATLARPDADYMRSLVKASGMTQAQAAEAIGISERAMRNYLSKATGKYIAPPYPVQYALEQLAAYIDKVES